MLLNEGVAVWGTARDVARLQNLSAQKKFTAIALDLAEGDQIERKFIEASERAHGFDLIINNAGFGDFAPFHQREGQEVVQQLETALLGSVRLAHAGIRLLKAC